MSREREAQNFDVDDFETGERRGASGQGEKEEEEERETHTQREKGGGCRAA